MMTIMFLGDHYVRLKSVANLNGGYDFLAIVPVAQLTFKAKN
jgi:hypothetical protein